ncbi:Acryloyl-CoA reductase (NADH) [Aquisphaera giovannonii]|uniref:Acryloyl-CoA reductase (NADH) n=1 Tax=Aquisphaera giovannonii TaxID=406548 RepID=A0A5B9W917_9BACT|nr:acyl-CoA dehydrogenase family protein [Aquisphaera giovannonii]QEH37112.1 Acryloyl-CoA reductase (NADH) [Aquisphaera giovannonii]
MSKSETGPPAWDIADPEAAVMSRLVSELAAADTGVDRAGVWSEPLWRLVRDAGATLWSIPTEQGGPACPRPLFLQRYAQLASASLTAAFVLSQHDAAVRRLSAAARHPAAKLWLDRIRSGDAFATVGISQLTTSRRLGAQALVATELVPGRYRLRGAMPWVTAAQRADVFVTGALMEDGRQLLVALPAERPGVAVRPPFALAALQASCTAEVSLDDVHVDDSDLLAEPGADQSSQPSAVGTAGLETSALALGQARAAIDALAGLAADKADLAEPSDELFRAWSDAWSSLLACARGEPDAPNSGHVRSRSNDLVLKATQAYLLARKGSGFVLSEPAQRWARQALFFLVWSCPTPLAQATIRDLAGLCPA